MVSPLKGWCKWTPRGLKRETSARSRCDSAASLEIGEDLKACLTCLWARGGMLFCQDAHHE